MSMLNVRSIPALEKGLVIDHIPIGYGLKVASLLKVLSKGYKLTLGINYDSSKMNKKDFIKIENLQTCDQLSLIAFFAPKATFNVIENYKIIKKQIVEPPKTVKGYFSCPNLKCITNSEEVITFFFVKKYVKDHVLNCKYCEKSFAVKDYLEKEN